MSNNPNGSETGSISYAEASGSKLTSVYVERKVKVYAVHEPELDSISLLNTASLGLFSIASFFLSVAVRDGFTQEMWSDPTSWFSGSLYFFGIVVLVFKKNIVKKIKEQSRPID